MASSANGVVTLAAAKALRYRSIAKREIWARRYRSATPRGNGYHCIGASGHVSGVRYTLTSCWFATTRRWPRSGCPSRPAEAENEELLRQVVIKVPTRTDESLKGSHSQATGGYFLGNHDRAMLIGLGVVRYGSKAFHAESLARTRRS